MYKQYQPLLDGTASLEVNDFLKEDQTLLAFSKVLHTHIQNAQPQNEHITIEQTLCRA